MWNCSGTGPGPLRLVRPNSRRKSQRSNSLIIVCYDELSLEAICSLIPLAGKAWATFAGQVTGDDPGRKQKHLSAGVISHHNNLLFRAGCL
jgi:hypothetical protein